MNIIIKETAEEDLKNVMDLWNDGEVMFYVGFPKARGKGIASYALSYVLNQVFELNLATKAWKLYERLGFVSKPRPTFLEPYETYLEITKDLFRM